MSNIDDSRRRPVLPDVERQMLRYQVFQKIRSYPRYENVIRGDLRPLWKVATQELPHPGFLVKRFRSIGTLGRPIANRPAVTAYVEAVHQAAKAFLLLQDGLPAMWACDFMHADVEPRAGADGLVEPDPIEPGGSLLPTDKPSAPYSAAYRHLTISVTPRSATFQDGERPMPVINDQLSEDVKRDQQTQLEASLAEWERHHVKRIPAGEFMRFAEWEELAKAAHEQLDRQLSELRSDFDDWYPNQQNPSTRPKFARRAETLGSMLMERSECTRQRDDAEVKRLGRFSSMIRLDYPGQKHPRKDTE